MPIDSREVTALAAALEARAVRIRPAVRLVVQRGSLNIKNDARRRWAGLSNAPALASAVTYDTHETLTGSTGQIGPDKARRQGALGNVIEYGTINNPPRPALAPALETEEPKFLKALEDVAGKELL